MLTTDEVRKIAALARVKLEDSEVEHLAKDLTNVLDYVDVLSEAPTDGVKETSQVNGNINIMEDDVVHDYSVSRDELLECTEFPVDSKQIKVIKVVNE